MHAGSAPVIRLESPLTLGHDVLLVISKSSLTSFPAAHASQVGRSKVFLLLPGAVPRQHRSGSQPYHRLSGDCLRVLTGLRPVKPGLAQRSRGTSRKSFLQTYEVGELRSARRRQDTPKKTIGMPQNCWQPHRKLLTSGNAVSARNGVRQRSEDGGSASCLGDFSGSSPAWRSRTVAGRSRLANNHPVHTCV